MAHRGRHSADDRLATAIAAGRAVRDAATDAGVAERTAFRRLQDPEFVAKVDRLRSEVVGTAMNRLATATTQAADVLVALLAEGDANVRFRASKALLELTLKLQEHGDVLRRLQELEARLAAMTQPE